MFKLNQQAKVAGSKKTVGAINTAAANTTGATTADNVDNVDNVDNSDSVDDSGSVDAATSTPRDRHNKIELPQELWSYIKNGTYIICTKKDGRQLFGYLTNYMVENNLIKMRTGYRKTPGGFVSARLDEIATIQAEADAVTMFLISKINAIVNVLGSMN